MGTITPAETISAFQTLVERLDTGHRQGTDPAEMNADATALGSAANVAPASLIHFHPGPFLRRFDIRDVEDQGGENNT